MIKSDYRLEFWVPPLRQWPRRLVLGYAQMWRWLFVYWVAEATDLRKLIASAHRPPGRGEGPTSTTRGLLCFWRRFRVGRRSIFGCQLVGRISLHETRYNCPPDLPPREDG